MDFDDLLVNGLRLFHDHPAVLERYQERFLYILVDEYQDTNTIQSAWIDALASARRNLLVVGDDFQSIYSWRGADYRNILSFPERYPGTTVFKLETNYRSVPEILEVANACIAGNPLQFQKTLRATREPYRKPAIARMRDGEAQAFYIAERLMHLRREGYKYSDVAVLYRSHFHALELQLELARRRVPYLITSGVRFFEQAHVKDVCSPLRLLANPTDYLAFTRLLEMFPKTGSKTAAKIWDRLGRQFNPRDPAQRFAIAQALPAMSQAVWKKIDPVFEAYVKENLAEDPGELIHRFVEAFYDDHALAVFENYERRMEDVRELIDYTTRFESAEAFLNEMALLTNVDAESDDPHAPPADAIRLSTVHQAKGLEWPVVFVLWLAEGMFPSAKTIANEDVELVAEERRLFYVASTRAKDELYLCVPALRVQRDGGLQYLLPSRFIDELPPALVTEE
jgi:DNA helicase-2/ATP-dependent DNA helicase PcrA